MGKYGFIVWGLMVFVAASLSGCATKEDPLREDPLRVDGRIIVGQNANPGYGGKPSPVVLRIYQLKAPSLFESADFFSLYDDDKAVLGEDLLSREQLDVRPGDVLSYQRDWDQKTRYVGVLAAFRDIENATWHAVVPVPSKGAVPLVVQVDELSVSLKLSSQH